MKKRLEKEPFFRVLTQYLTQLSGKKGAYRVQNVVEKIGKSSVNIRNGAYTVLVAWGVAFMPYTLD